MPEDLIDKARRQLRGLADPYRFNDHQLLELIRLGGEGSAASTIRVVANELAQRLKEKEEDGNS
jgi:hypothetical protein